MPDFSLSTWERVADLPREWDVLSSDATIYSSLGWLGIREEELPDTAQARYSMAWRGSVPAAGLTGYCFEAPPHRLYDPVALLSDFMKDGDAQRYRRSPFVIGSGWSEFRGEILRGPEPSDADVAPLVRDMSAWADELDARLLAFLYLPIDDARAVCDALGGDAVPVLHDFETVLPIAWSTFDDYLSWLPGRLRGRARRDLRTFLSSGRHLEEARLGDVVDIVAPLNSALMRKYGHDFDTAKARTVYDRQARHLSDQSSVLIARDGDSPVGFVLRYQVGDHMYARVVGFDYEQPKRADYFMLSFYGAVRHGIENSMCGVHLGLGTLEAKMGRGAQPAPLYNVYVGLPGEPGVLKSAHRLSENRVATFEEKYAKIVVGGVDTASWAPSRW